jgi:hypothetical protein
MESDGGDIDTDRDMGADRDRDADGGADRAQTRH